MANSSKFVSMLLVIILLLVGTSTAMAGAPTNSHDVVIEEGVTWSLPAGTCDAAPAGLAGKGQRHQVINTRVNPDGSTVITTNDVVRGDAWDSTGAYKFQYENHSVVLVPVGAGARQVRMEDNFIVNGNGSVGHLAVGFNWQWTFTPPAEMWPPIDNWQQHSTHGDPLHCDPL